MGLMEEMQAKTTWLQRLRSWISEATDAAGAERVVLDKSLQWAVLDDGDDEIHDPIAMFPDKDKAEGYVALCEGGCTDWVVVPVLVDVTVRDNEDDRLKLDTPESKR